MYDPATVRRTVAERQAEGLGLFDWPEARTEMIEQTVLPVGGTIEARWQAWRDGPGQVALVRMGEEAVRRVDELGETRLSAKALVEEYRREHHAPINNVLTPMIARWIEAHYPATAGRFERRARSAT